MILPHCFYLFFASQLYKGIRHSEGGHSLQHIQLKDVLTYGAYGGEDEEIAEVAPVGQETVSGSYGGLHHVEGEE